MDWLPSFLRTRPIALVRRRHEPQPPVPANIAEGKARGTKRDYANFLSVAKSSLMETETFLMLAVRLKYITQVEASTAFALVTEVSKMLTSLRNRLKEDGN